MFKAKIIFSLLLVILVGCQPKSKPSLQNYLKINIKDEPHTLDPRLARDPSSQMILRMLGEGLVRIGPNDKPQLALAENLEISEDYRTYVFTLKNAYWSNGDPIRAQDFVYSWKKTLSPHFISDNAFQLYVIRNGKRVKEGVVEAEELGVKAAGEKTLVVELEYPVPYALELFASPYFFPVNQAVDEANSHWAEKDQTYVGNGPFMMQQWAHQDTIIVQKNPKYWDEKNVKLSGIEMMMVDHDAELKMFEKKQVHWCGSPLSVIPVDALNHLKKEKNLHVKPMAETAFLRANTKRSVLSEVKLRNALALAIDRKGIVEHVTQGGQLPATKLVPPSMQLTQEAYFEDGAKEQASLMFEEVLAEKSIRRKDFPKLTLIYIASERTHLIAQTLQQQWFEAFGIQINLEAVERKVYFDKISRQDFDLAFCSWGADFHDPINFLEVFKYRSQSTNNTNWEDPVYIQKLNDSTRAIDQNERTNLLAESEKILMKAMPIIPIFHYSMVYMKAEGVKGVVLTSLGHLDFKWAWIENGEL